MGSLMSPQQATLSHMPPDTAVYPQPPAPQRYAQPIIPSAPRIVWPWPMFLLGAAALIAVWVGRPYWRPTNADRVKRELQEARGILGRPSPDLNRALELGQKALEQGSVYPQYVGEASFLMGCVYLKQAEDAPEPEAKWQEARRCFEKAEAAGAPEADKVRLAYCLGKVLHLTKADPVRALDYIRKGDDPEAAGERWQLMAECCLTQNPPDVKGAIDATNNQIPLILQGDGRSRASAYYRLAELHLRRNQVPDARKALEEIRVPDSQEVYDSSRVLLARCYQAEGSYALATTTWEAVRTKSKPVIDKGAIDFELGWCYWKTGRDEEAKKVWDEAQTLGGEPGQASQLRKAEMQLADLSNRARAVPTLEDALKSVQKPADYHNSLYSVVQAQQLLERSCQEFKAVADWASAGKLAELLTRLSGANKGKELAAEIAQAWGLSLQKKAAGEAGQAASHDVEEAAKQFRCAATLAAELATADLPKETQAEWLRRAANNYLNCGDKLDVQNAVAMIDRMQKLGVSGAIEGELSFLRALSFARLGEIDQALEAYRVCLTPNNPKQFRARCDMVNLVVNQAGPIEEKLKRIDQAAETLAPNLDPAVHDQDAVTAEESAHLMGHLMYIKRDWSRAEAYLVAAISQYPKNDQALNSRYLLSQCYYYMAYLESQRANDSNLSEQERDKAQKRRQDFLEKSRATAEPLQEDLIKLEQEQKMTEAERTLLWLASCRAVECYFFLGKFEDAARLYNLLRMRCAKPVDEIKVLSQLWQCSYSLNDRDKCASYAADLRNLLKSLPNEAFDNSSELNSRAHWEEWLKRVDDISAKSRPGGPASQLPAVNGPKG
jgi:hypothetical protein